MSMRKQWEWLAVAVFVGLVIACGCPPADDAGGDGDGGGNDPNGTAQLTGPRVYGIVYDAATDQPLSGVNIAASGVDTPTQTDANGRFMLSVPATGDYALTATLANYTYAQRRATVTAGGMATVSDMYLTPIDPQAIRIGPGGGSGSNSDDSIRLSAPAGALDAETDLHATWYDEGQDLPNDLPELSHFTYACELTPDGQTFNQPVTVRMRNTRGFPAGTPIPVGVYSSTTLEWTHESMGVVSSDGQWVDYQVEHFSPRDCNLGRTSPTGSGEPGDAEDVTADERAQRTNQSCGSVPAGSRVDVGDGHLMVTHLTPAYTTLGRQRTVALQYNSPMPQAGVLLELSYDISQTRVELPPRQKLIAEIAGHRVERTYTPVEGPATFSYRWDGRDPLGNEMSSGTYDYSLTLVNEYAVNFATVGAFGGSAVTDTGVAADEYLNLSSTFTGSVAYVATADANTPSPYGEGWGLVGVHTLEVASTGATVTGGDGSRFTFNDDGAGNYSPGRGDSSTLTHNTNDTYTWAQPNGLRVTFDDRGRQTRLTDRQGNATQFAYSGDRLTTVTDPLGRETTLAYDANDRLSTITDPAGRTTRLTVDSDGDLTQITNPDSTTRRFVYDSNHRLTGQTDAGGQQTAYVYNTAGAVTRVNRPDGTHTLHAAAAEGQASYTDPGGNQYLFAVNAFGTRTAITDPLGRTTLMGRDPNDQMTSYITPSGRRCDYAYDAAGNMTRASGFGRSANWPDTLTITYDANLNLPTRIVDSMAGTWTAEYDASGNLTRARVPGGGAYTCTYNARGQRTAITIDGETTTITYDPNGNVATVTDGAGGVWRYGYDAYGNINQLTDADGRIWTLTYNAMNLLERVTNALGESVEFTYAPALGSLDIDMRGAVAVATGITDGRGNTTTYTYDAMYRPTAITDALGNATQIAYDPNGRVATRTEPTGATVGFSYNAAGQLTERAPSVGETATYTYDPNTGLCTRMATPTCRLDYQYDWFDLVTQVDTTFAAASLTATVDYEYRTSNYGETLITLSVGGDSSDFGFAWDPSAGWRPDEWYGGGYIWFYPRFDAVGRLTQQYESYSGTQVDYGYDNAGRMTSTAMTGSSGGGTVNWTYSPAGYRATMVHPDGTHTYTYDAAGRLTGATHPTGDNPNESYTYDAAGNIRAAGFEANYTYDAANRLTRDPTHDYTYDASGNLIRRVDRTTSDTTQYAYDAENRLLSAALPSGTTVSYAYDALGRRCQRSDGVNTTYYVYEGDEVLAEFDGSGNLRRQFVHGPHIDMLEAVKIGGFVAYDNYLYARDPLGTIMYVTDMNANGQATYRYQAFGAPVHISGALGDGRMFAGLEYDADTGLYHCRRREYDPTTGRFLQRDPLPIPGATMPYAYAANNPTGLRDPFGLEPAAEAAAFGSFMDQYVVQPGINTLTIEGIGMLGNAVSALPFPYSAGAGAFTVAAVGWEQYYGTDGHPSWSDIVSVFGADNPAQAGVDWYGSQWWNPARGHLDDFLTLGGLFPRREARVGPICGLREGLFTFFGR